VVTPVTPVTPLTTSVPAYPEHLRADVERYLESLRFSAELATAGLDEAMRYSLLAGGKRIRPVLALATAEALGQPRDRLLPLAAALELIHTYSLIHDDLPAMDDDDLRRGRMSCHRAFGEDVAILAGDGLYAEAFRLLLSKQQAEATDLLAAACELAAATGVQGMVGGQYLDVTGSEATLGKQQGSDARLGKRTYVSEFGLHGARRLAEACRDRARAALHAAAPTGASELERITDFIATRSY